MLLKPAQDEDDEELKEVRKKTDPCEEQSSSHPSKHDEQNPFLSYTRSERLSGGF